jgi:hypothetical protein
VSRESYNEWDPLEEVLVGMVDGAMVPSWHTIYRATVPPIRRRNLDDLIRQLQEYRLPYPKRLVRAAIKNLEEFIHILESEGLLYVGLMSWTTLHPTPLLLGRYRMASVLQIHAMSSW